MGTIKQVPFDQLDADPQNPRLPHHAEGTHEALILTLRWQGAEKLEVLANDIAANGLNPLESFFVLKSNDERYLVLEGNRRLAAMRAMLDPDLVSEAFDDGGPDLPSEYSAPVTIACVEVERREEADGWIEKKHRGQQKGAGVLPWSSVQGARFDARRNTKRPELEVLDFVLKHSPDLTIGDGFPLATLKRMVTSSHSSVLGVEVSKGVARSDWSVRALLSVWRPLVEKVADKKNFGTNNIRHKEQQGELAMELVAAGKPDTTERTSQPRPLSKASPSDRLDKVLAFDGPSPDSPPARTGDGPASAPQPPPGAPATPTGGTTPPPSAAPSPTGAATTGADAPPTQAQAPPPQTVPPRAPTPPSNLRAKGLEPRSTIGNRVLTEVRHARLHGMYEELIHKDLHKFPNAAGAVLRSFLELTADVYEGVDPAFQHRVEWPNDLKPAKLEDYQRRDFNRLPLRIKVQLLAKRLRGIGAVDPGTAEAVFLAAGRNSGPGSLPALHAWLHNSESTPTAAEVKADWDAWEDLFVACWKAHAESKRRRDA